ncbi:MAG: hypothetical protein K0S64_663 [Gaiellaceae bacterium]|nr:hypothetical protein [Gaiellaceae bacterium]
MTTHDAPSAASGPLVLADISGYSSFLRSVADEHRNDAFADGAVPDGYRVISSLLDGIVSHFVPPFTLSKLEGDAVFAYATDPEELPRGQAMFDRVRECYAAFRQRVETAQSKWQCWCEACAKIDELDLKFVLHAGPFVIQPIAGRPELAGSEVVVAHRLLKSRAGDLLDRSGFMLVTDAASDWFDLPAGGGVPLVETLEGCAPLGARAFGFA